MKKYLKEDVAGRLLEAKMIPVFYHHDLEICKKAITACYNGGLRVFEYTNRGEKAIINFPILLDFVRSEFPDMLLGIGSIVNKEQALDFIAINADFIVAPILDTETGNVCNEKEVYWIPGCATLSEIAMAEKIGADIIKIFPGSVLGPEFVKAVRGPMPWLKLMPTGGVEPSGKNLKAWFDAGVVCVGMGSKLINEKIIAQPKELSERIKETLKLIESLTK